MFVMTVVRPPRRAAPQPRSPFYRSRTLLFGKFAWCHHIAGGRAGSHAWPRPHWRISRCPVSANQCTELACANNVHSFPTFPAIAKGRPPATSTLWC